MSMFEGLHLYYSLCKDSLMTMETQYAHGHCKSYLTAFPFLASWRLGRRQKNLIHPGSSVPAPYYIVSFHLKNKTDIKIYACLFSEHSSWADLQSHHLWLCMYVYVKIHVCMWRAYINIEYLFCPSLPCFWDRYLVSLLSICWFLGLNCLFYSAFTIVETKVYD